MYELDQDFETGEKSGRRFNLFNLLAILLLLLSTLMIACYATLYLMPSILPVSYMPATPTLASTAAPPPTLAQGSQEEMADSGVPPTWTPP